MDVNPANVLPEDSHFERNQSLDRSNLGLLPASDSRPPPARLSPQEEYDRCPKKCEMFERHQTYLLEVAAFLVVMGLVFVMGFNSTNLLYVTIATYSCKYVRSFYTFLATARPSTTKEVLHRAFLVVNFMASMSFWIFYISYFKSSLYEPSKPYQYSALGPLIASSFHLLVDLSFSKMATIAHLLSRLTKLWRIGFFLSVYIMFVSAEKSAATSDLKIDTSKAPVFIWMFGVQAIFFILMIYFISKFIETRVFITKRVHPNRQFIEAVNTYLLCLSVSAYLVALIMYLTCQGGLFAHYDNLKAAGCFICAAVCLTMVLLNFRGREQLKIFFQLPVAEVHKFYPTCSVFRKKISNQVSSLPRQRSQEVARAGTNIGPGTVVQRQQSDNSLPASSGSHGVSSNLIPQRPPTPVVVANASFGSNTIQNQVQSLDRGSKESERDQSLESCPSIRYIERKNSIMFNEINPKKVLEMLKAEGHIEKSKVIEDDEALTPTSKQDFPQNHKNYVAEEDIDDLNRGSELPVNQIRRRVHSAGAVCKKLIVGAKNQTRIEAENVFEKLKEVMFADPTEEQLQQIRDSKSFCLICEKRESNCIIYPCFHSKVCYKCSVRMLSWQYSKCHFCRGPLEKIIVVDVDHSYKNIFKVLEVYTVNYE